MEIRLFYSRTNASHQKSVAFVKRAVENLGISAKIIECDMKMGIPKVIVDGFDLTNQLRKPGNGSGNSISYESVVKALERTAW